MKPECNRRQTKYANATQANNTHHWGTKMWKEYTTFSDRFVRVGMTDHSGSYHNNLQSIRDNSEVRCLHRAKRILKGNSQPATVCSLCYYMEKHTGKRSIQFNTRRLRGSFFPPAVTLLISSSLLYHGFFSVAMRDCILLHIPEL